MIAGPLIRTLNRRDESAASLMEVRCGRKLGGGGGGFTHLRLKSVILTSAFPTHQQRTAREENTFIPLEQVCVCVCARAVPGGTHQSAVGPSPPVEIKYETPFIIQGGLIYWPLSDGLWNGETVEGSVTLAGLVTPKKNIM